MSLLLQPESTVLFQGDSITDAGRNRHDPFSLGNGYAMIAAAWFGARFPDRGVTFLNRGISGNRVPDLLARWEEDCHVLEPDWISILIGINDVWRGFDHKDPTSVESYEANYRKLLEQTCTRHPKSRLVMLEPFVLPFPEDRIAWREDLDPKIDAARRLAREFEAIYVPLDGIFAAAACRRPPAFWAADGVHPTPEGHGLIAQAWLSAVGAN